MAEQKQDFETKAIGRIKELVSALKSKKTEKQTAINKIKELVLFLESEDVFQRVTINKIQALITSLEDEELTKIEKWSGDGVLLLEDSRTFHSREILRRELFKSLTSLAFANTENERLRFQIENPGEDFRIAEFKETVKQLKGEIFILHDRLKERDIKENELSRQIQQEKILHDKTISDFKQFIKKHHLPNVDVSKSLDFITAVFSAVKDFRDFQSERKETPVNNERDLPSDLGSYISSQKCLCGNEKRYGSKGCSECRMKADAIRNREDIGMAEAWKDVWSSYRFFPEENMEMEEEND